MLPEVATYGLSWCGLFTTTERKESIGKLATFVQKAHTQGENEFANAQKRRVKL